MKNQLLNLKMIALMCLMMVLGGANVWAQKAQTIFLETFGANNAKKSTVIDSYSGYSATDVMFVTGNAKSNYSGDGKIGLKTKQPSEDYEGVSGESNCFHQGAKNEKGIILKISNINIKDFKNIKLSLGAFGVKGDKLDVSYIVDGGAEKTLSSKSVSGNWILLSYDIPVSGSNLTLIFSHTPKNTWVIRVDDIKLAGVKASAEPTYTAQALTFIAKDGADYYATFSSDKVTFITSKHVIPHVVTVANGKVDMKSEMFKSEKTTIESAEVDGYYIPANTGILLYSDAENVDYYTVENKTVDALAEGTNMLKPAPATTSVFTAETGYKYYKLAYDDYKAQKGLGFYWGAANGGAFKVKAGTAYLAVPADKAAGAKGFAFNDEATGIEGVNANVENVKAIYNINGQRVASMAKPGLYIVNGKKVVRK